MIPENKKYINAKLLNFSSSCNEQYWNGNENTIFLDFPASETNLFSSRMINVGILSFYSNFLCFESKRKYWHVLFKRTNEITGNHILNFTKQRRFYYIQQNRKFIVMVPQGNVSYQRQVSTQNLIVGISQLETERDLIKLYIVQIDNFKGNSFGTT